MISAEQVIIGCFLVAVPFAIGGAYFDLRTRKIPNKYNLAGLILGLLLKVILAILMHSWTPLITGLLGLLIGFVIFFPAFVLRLAGAGDVKLLTVLGLILGWKSFLWVFLFTGLLDGLLLVLRYARVVYVIIILPMSWKEKVQNFGQLFNERRSPKNPYGFPVALGCISGLLFYLYRQPTFFLRAVEDFFHTSKLFL